MSTKPPLSSAQNAQPKPVRSSTSFDASGAAHSSVKRHDTLSADVPTMRLQPIVAASNHVSTLQPPRKPQAPGQGVSVLDSSSTVKEKEPADTSRNVTDTINDILGHEKDVGLDGKNGTGKNKAVVGKGKRKEMVVDKYDDDLPSIFIVPIDPTALLIMEPMVAADTTKPLMGE